MIDCLRTCVHKQQIIGLYFEFVTVLKFYNLKPSTKQRIKCLAKGHNAVPQVRLELLTPRSQVNHSTTEPRSSLFNPLSYERTTVIIFLPINLKMCFWCSKNSLIERVLLSIHNICFG